MVKIEVPAVVVGIVEVNVIECYSVLKVSDFSIATYTEHMTIYAVSFCNIHYGFVPCSTA